MITNNFGLFKIQTLEGQMGLTPNYSIAGKDNYENCLLYAIDEIKIGTVDSLTRCIKMLELQDIHIPSVNILLNLQENTQGIDRDNKFAETVETLKIKVLQEIEEKLH